MTIRIRLADTARTLTLGRLLAQSIPAEGPCPAILLQGTLGAGKTTLVRGLVAALPGGENAEVSSPSFNLLNLYPTRPETAHVDLYRLKGGEPDETVAETLETGGRLVVVEWAEYLPERLLPEVYLRIQWIGEPGGERLVNLSAAGTACGVVERLRGRLRGSMRPEESLDEVDG